ncbi:excalibur calcium-binding domain-containing protein [Nocardia sp. NPDC051929]|uniref:excalibur calcium-binding domain-containing protein n=1 Tax=Nocardia sp. NPDC051929 TaxID=3364327 RepID=UPI0037CA540F
MGCRAIARPRNLQAWPRGLGHETDPTLPSDSTRSWIGRTSPTGTDTDRPRPAPREVRANPCPAQRLRGVRRAVSSSGLVDGSEATAPAPPAAVVPTPPAPAVPVPPRPAAPSVYYSNCAAAKAAGAAPLRRGEPGYRSELDRDKDGIACE